MLEDRATLGVAGGVFTPGGLAGSGGPAAITRLVSRLEAVGIRFRVDEERALLPRRAEGGEGGEGAAARRPTWQSALNALALAGWCAALVTMLVQWPHVSAGLSTPLMRLTLSVEAICVFEVCQIALGLARGNLVLGVVLHYTRVIIALVVFPIVPTHLASRLVLLAWRGTVRRVVPAAAAPARFAPPGRFGPLRLRRGGRNPRTKSSPRRHRPPNAPIATQARAHGGPLWLTRRATAAWAPQCSCRVQPLPRQRP